MLRFILSKEQKILAAFFGSLFIWTGGILMAPLLTVVQSSLSFSPGDFMYFLYKPVCHQIPERSFHLWDGPLAVCIRCLGIYCGGLITLLVNMHTMIRTLWRIRYDLFLAIPACIQFVIAKFQIGFDPGLLRFGMGVLLGMAIFHLLLCSLTEPKFEKPGIERIV